MNLVDGTTNKLTLSRKALLQCLRQVLLVRETGRDILLKHFFDSKLLSMRPPQYGDEDLYIKLFSNEKITTYTGGVLNYAKIKEAFNSSLHALTKLPIENLTWVVKTKANQDSIGILNLTWHDQQVSFAEVGVMLTLRNQNKGYCFELLTAFINHCFNQSKLTTLYSFTLSNNLPAQRVLQKVLFTKTSSLPYKSNGLDGHYWALNKGTE